MTEQNHSQRYEELIGVGAHTGKIDMQPPEEDRRAHPRFKLEGTELTIAVHLIVSAIDISRSGVSFYSNYSFRMNQLFALDIGQVFSVTAEVTECTLEETDSSMMETRYRVRSRFLEDGLDVEKLLTIIDK
jgi:hypothetical protein